MKEEKPQRVEVLMYGMEAIKYSGAKSRNITEEEAKLVALFFAENYVEDTLRIEAFADQHGWHDKALKGKYIQDTYEENLPEVLRCGWVMDFENLSIRVVSYPMLNISRTDGDNEDFIGFFTSAVVIDSNNNLSEFTDQDHLPIN